MDISFAFGTITRHIATTRDLRKNAQESVDAARANYEKARLEANQKLEDARSQLEDAHSRILEKSFSMAFI